MAIKETQDYFSKYRHITFISTTSTAVAIDEMKHNKKDSVAVISSKSAIESSKLHLIAEDIQDHKNNMTTFCLIAL